MARCVIFCAGEFDGFLLPPQKDDYIIAADGGLAHLDRLSITPHAILGDFDSLGYTPAGAQVFPVEKDDTDALLAIRHGLLLGYKEFVLYGALEGPRLDHTLANLQALEFLSREGAVGYLVGNRQIATVLRNECISFPTEAEGTLSVFCMGEDARGVTLSGLKYGLADGTLSAAFPLGVSNSFQGEKAQICVTEGSLLVIFDRKNRLPERKNRSQNFHGKNCK